MPDMLMTYRVKCCKCCGEEVWQEWLPVGSVHPRRNPYTPSWEHGGFLCKKCLGEADEI